MPKQVPWLGRLPLHPFLFAVYPILALLAFNRGEVGVSSAVRPLGLSLLLAAFVFLLFRWIFRGWERAALLSTLLLVLFYSYGHVYIALKGITLDGGYVFRHRTLLPLWLGLGALSIWWVARWKRSTAAVTYWLNLTGLVLLALPLLQLMSFAVQEKRSQTTQADSSVLRLSASPQPPDVYYIVLDGYGRSDILKNEYGFDNTDFLDGLRGLEFEIAECSQSNYAQTQLSLASSLNMNYIDALSDRFVPGSDDRTGLDTLIHHSIVRESLESAGYKTVAFATGFLATELTDADYFLSPERSLGVINEFEYLLMETTLARLLQDSNRFGMQASGSERFRERTLFALDQLGELSYIPGPKFVFAHIIAPHPPYVFGPTGGPVESSDVGGTQTQEGANRYRDQAIYISNRILEVVPKIIAGSATPPVIVIQGDHGPTVASSPRSRMSNLQAYFLPGVQDAGYPTLTPVNIFRIVFNEYFGQNLELLDDISLYSEYTDPFRFRVIQNLCEAGE